MLQQAKEKSYSHETPIEDLRVPLDRLKDNIEILGRHGYQPSDHGIYRMAFTEADVKSRKWLMDQMSEIGMAVCQDGAGNVIGHWPPDNREPAVIIGSHTDTVPCGGKLDGSLGVMTGLECARTLIEAEVRTEHPIEIISFSDEEGRFGGMLGSQAFTGQLTPDLILNAVDLNGIKLPDAMKHQGFDPLGALDARREPDTIQAYLELHIEQGPVLDHLKKSVGIVDEITGLFRWSARLVGTANHAGTTPMEMRQDAFLGLAEFANELPRILEENGSERSRATIGNVSLNPGAANTVPGAAEFSLDVRDTDPDRLEELFNSFRKALSAIARRRKLHFEFEEVSRIEPVHCDPEVVKALRAQADRMNISHELMPSGAAHDAQLVAGMAPVGLIFVPSQDGKSHSPAEWTPWHDIETGANLILQTAIQLMKPL
ncbi:MAG: Zn-dependent hydrolase [Verrucomicrobiota bacterium]